MPRLARFAEAHPEIDLVLDPTLRLADLAGDEADLAIRYGDGSWEGSENRLLMTEVSIRVKVCVSEDGLAH